MSLANKIVAPALTSGLLALASLTSRADIVSQWNFNENSGLTTYDSTGNDNTGTLQNGVQWTTDSREGYALRFDGTDDRVSVLGTSVMNLTENVSLEAWIKRDSMQDGTIFSRNGPFFIAVRNNHFYGGIHTNGGPEGWTDIEGTSNLALNQWYHVAMSYDGATIRGYVNSIEEASSPKSGIMVLRSQQPWIGWGEPGQNQYFSGVIDNIKVHDIAAPSRGTLTLLALGGLMAARRARK